MQGSTEPGAAGYDAPSRQDVPFYIAPEARPWFVGSGRRIASVVGDVDAAVWQIVLSEPASSRERQSSVGHMAVRPGAAGEPSVLLPIAGDDRGRILSQMDDLRRRLEAGASVPSVVAVAYERYASEPEAPYALALVGRKTGRAEMRDAILKEMAFAAEGVAAADRQDWETPGGSVFTAHPLGSEGVAFVYPGAFNSYIGLGKDLFQHFPELHERLSGLVSDLGRAVADRHIYPRSRAWMTEKDLLEKQAQLTADAPALIESGTVFAVAHTLVMCEAFGVQPQAALGYSLGETSMLWAAGVWQDGDEGASAMRSSPLFGDRIVGPKVAVREHWGLDPEEDVDWAVFLLKARAGDVREALQREPRVYLTLINQPGEVVIAGNAAGCQRVIDALACHVLPVPYDVVIHAEAIRSEYEAFADLYTHPVANRPPMHFYSAADYGRLKLESEALADAMARMTCQPVDFPRLVQRVYDDGTRVFVELGPLGTCTRRIKRILRGKPHSAVAINPSVGDDFDGVIRALAHLVAHRVPMDLSSLYASPMPLPAPPLSWVEGETPEAPHELPPAGLEGLVEAYGRRLLPHRQRVAMSHGRFLEARHAAQVGAGALIGMQLSAGRVMLGTMEQAGHRPTASASPPVYGEAELTAFATGDVEKCFGPDFAVYRGRRLPRIPNGDLLLMSRIVHITGSPEGGRNGVEPVDESGKSLKRDSAQRRMPSLQGEHTLVSEFDVPEGVWFYQDDAAVPSRAPRRTRPSGRARPGGRSRP